MRILFCAILLAICQRSEAQQRRVVAPPPTEFEIGRRTFFDFGPPFDYYNVYSVRPTASGTAVERVTLTPASNECFEPATVETSSIVISEPSSSLWGTTNPCAIPDKELQKELKRCKNCLTFSGAVIAIQVQCGSQARLIRSDILDKDMFDPRVKTPENTSWTMGLLQRLDQAFGSSVMDKPAFSLANEETEGPGGNADSPTIRDLIDGKYDALFKSAADKPSQMYRAAQLPRVRPTVELTSSEGVLPQKLSLPAYPPLARIARVEGDVSFRVEVDSNGAVTNIEVESGPPLLQEIVRQAAKGWTFPKTPQSLHATIRFALNCPPRPPKP